MEKQQLVEKINNRHHQFELYCAAVKKAELASGGSGDLNAFDHVAKDLHEEGFDEKMEELENWRLNAYRSQYDEAIEKLAEAKYLV